mmetsp:Transcript_20036/g.53541  ORF Transcript_20036/g.53541 Transcript_20036/m.53541 type:complete len:261 (-) Transcript_20036:2-784(-)
MKTHNTAHHLQRMRSNPQTEPGLAKELMSEVTVLTSEWKLRLEVRWEVMLAIKLVTAWGVQVLASTSAALEMLLVHRLQIHHHNSNISARSRRGRSNLDHRCRRCGFHHHSTPRSMHHPRMIHSPPSWRNQSSWRNRSNHHHRNNTPRSQPGANSNPGPSCRCCNRERHHQTTQKGACHPRTLQQTSHVVSKFSSSATSCCPHSGGTRAHHPGKWWWHELQAGTYLQRAPNDRFSALFKRNEKGIGKRFLQGNPHRKKTS